MDCEKYRFFLNQLPSPNIIVLVNCGIVKSKLWWARENPSAVRVQICQTFRWAPKAENTRGWALLFSWVSSPWHIFTRTADGFSRAKAEFAGLMYVGWMSSLTRKSTVFFKYDVDNKILKANVSKKDCIKDTRIDPERMPDKWCRDIVRSCRKRPYPSTGIGATVLSCKVSPDIIQTVHWPVMVSFITASKCYYWSNKHICPTEPCQYLSIQEII